MGNVLQFWATSVWLYNNYRGPRVYLLRFFPVKATAVPSGMAYAILFYVRFVPAWISLGQLLERFAGCKIIQRAAYFYIWMVNSGSWLRSRFNETQVVLIVRNSVFLLMRDLFFFSSGEISLEQQEVAWIFDRLKSRVVLCFLFDVVSGSKR